MPFARTKPKTPAVTKAPNSAMIQAKAFMSKPIVLLLLTMTPTSTKKIVDSMQKV